MKRITSLALSLSMCAACLLPANAEAANIMANGVFTARGNYFVNDNFSESAYDPFNIGSNLMLGLNVAVSPNLYGIVLLRNLDASWGNSNGSEIRSNGWQGDSSLGIFLGYVQYNSDYAKLTVGQVDADKGSYTFGNALNSTLPMAGVQARFEINDKANLDLAYYRPSATMFTNAAGTTDYSVVEGGAINLVEASLPMSFDSFKIRPYAGYMTIGENNVLALGTPLLDIGAGVYGTGYASATNFLGTKAYLAGFSTLVSPMDYLTLSLDFQYGSATTEYYTGTDHANRAGFIIGAGANYELTFGNLGLIGWYGSGDDADASNGSERAVVFATTAPNMVAKLAGPFAGDLFFDFDTTIMDPSATGVSQLPGTMGATLALSNLSFADKLYHSAWINYTQGTSENTAYNILIGNGYTNMTIDDSIVQFGLANWYIVNRNLNFAFEIAHGFGSTGTQVSADPLMLDLRMNYMF